MKKLIEVAVNRLKETPEQKQVKELESVLKSMTISCKRAINSLEQDIISLKKDLEDTQSKLDDAKIDLEEALYTIPTNVDKKKAYEFSYLKHKESKQQIVREVETQVTHIKNQIIEKEKAIMELQKDLERFES